MGWMAPLRHLGAKMPVGQKPPANREPSMNEITDGWLTRLHRAEVGSKSVGEIIGLPANQLELRRDGEAAESHRPLPQDGAATCPR